MNNNTIGNEEMMDIFDETIFTRKGTRNRNTKEYQEMIKLYKLDEIAIPDDVVVYFQEALSALPDQATQTQFSERFGYLNAG